MLKTGIAFTVLIVIPAVITGQDVMPPAGTPGHVVYIAPVAAPPGTTVRLFATGFSPNQLVQISSGASADALAQSTSVRADRRGIAEARVSLPSTAPAGSTWLLAASSADGRIRAFSRPFRVLASPGGSVSPPVVPPPATGDEAPRRMTVTGTLTADGVECPAMQGDDGRLYTLTGNLRGFVPGDLVRVEGTVAEVSFCMQGTTINVERIERP